MSLSHVPHSFIIIYVLLATVVVALGLSFIQLYKHPQDKYRTYVPRCHILWQRHAVPDEYIQIVNRQYNLHSLAPFHNQLVISLTESYHVMTLYLIDFNRGLSRMRKRDTLYCTCIAVAPVTVRIMNEKEVVEPSKMLTPGDAVTIPTNYTILFDNINNIVSLDWSLHPVTRPYKIAKRDEEYIHKMWKRKKVRSIEQ